MKIKTLISFLIFATFLFGCRPSSEEYDRNPLKVVVPKDYTKKQIVSEITSTLTYFRWTVDDISDEKIKAHLFRNGHKAEVIMKYSLTEIVILNNTKPIKVYDRNDREKQATQYIYLPYGWLANIKKVLDLKFSNTAKQQQFNK